MMLRTRNENVYIPRKPAHEISFDATRGTARNRTLPVSLVVENSREVTDYVDDAKDEAVARAHRQVRAACVALNGSSGRRGGEKFVHLGYTAYLVACRVDGEDESEDDGEQDGGVSAGEEAQTYGD